MTTHTKQHVALFALFGFFFGTAGLLILSALSLMSPSIEVLAAPFLAPGRFAAEYAIGPNGSNTAVMALMLFNGSFYALLSVIFGIFFCDVLEKRK